MVILEETLRETGKGERELQKLRNWMSKFKRGSC